MNIKDDIHIATFSDAAQQRKTKRKESEGEVSLSIFSNFLSDLIQAMFVFQVDVMSVTPRRSWPPGTEAAGASNAQTAGGSGEGQRMPHQGAGSGHRPSGGTAPNVSHLSNNSNGGPGHPSQLEPPSSGVKSHNNLKPPMPTQQPMQQQQQQHQHQQQRQIPTTTPSSGSLFSPSSMPELNQQQNLFVNGQSGSYSTPGMGQMNNAVKAENMSSGSHYDFQQHGGMNDFDQMQMGNDNLFNALASQQNHGPQQHQQQQMPNHLHLSDVKSMSQSASSPALSMPPHHGGKPKSHSAAMNQVKNASSWSSLAGGPSQMGGGPSSKTSNSGDSFQMFKRKAEEKEARQKALQEQQEMRRQQKEQAEREKIRAEADRRREREEEEALEKARY